VRLRAAGLALDTEFAIIAAEGTSVGIQSARSEQSFAKVAVSKLFRLRVDLTERGRFVAVITR
jgi:hypothetical protein